MNLILIEPNIEGRISEPPLNISLLKAFVNQKTQHHAKIIDLTFHKKNWQKYIFDMILDFDVDLIGISCLSFNYYQAIEIAKFLKSKFDLPIIFGGIHVILMPEEVIQNECVDMVCIGEGEYVLKDLLDNVLTCDSVEGIWYKDNGKVIKNNKRELIQDLDSLPFPDWEDYDLKKYFKINGNHIGITCSRGCPYQCTFCASHAIERVTVGKWTRFRSVDNVLHEINYMIEKYSSKGLKYFKFHDSTFNANESFVFEFCEKYTNLGLNKKFLWTSGIRANLVTENMIRVMSNAGCYQILIGVESIDDYIRNIVYKKNISKKQIYDTIKWVKKYGIQLNIAIIIGSPYDTKEIMEENLKFAKSVNAEVQMWPVLMPLPGTEIKELCKKEGLIENTKFVSNEMFTKPMTKTKYMASNEIKAFAKKVRKYLVKKYFFDGLKMKNVRFLFDLVVFFVYYKQKYGLELDNAWRFTINKYNLEKHIKCKCIDRRCKNVQYK